MEISIEIHNLNKSFNKKKVLNEISLTSYDNNITAVVGPNGAGKTTLIKSIIGSIIKNSGTISIKGKELTTENQDYKKLIGYIPEDTRILPTNSKGYQFIRYIGRLKGLSYESAKRDQEEICKLLMCENFVNKSIGKMSSGMKQTIAIAQAFIGYPQVILADEPTVHLDPIIKQKVFDIFSDFTKMNGNSVLISSHILSEIQKIATFVNIINYGKIIFSGSMKEFLKSSDYDLILKVDNVQELNDYLNNNMNEFGIEKIHQELQNLYVKTFNNDLFSKKLPVALVEKNCSIYELKNNENSLDERFFQIIKFDTNEEI